MTEKYCSGCSQTLPHKAFERDSRGYGDGLRHRCRKCRRDAFNDWKKRSGFSNAKFNKRWRSDPENARREKEAAKLYRAANAGAERARYREWRIANRAKRTSDAIAYKARKAGAAPPWANKKYLDLWYEIAKLESDRTGRVCHVDHIVPLKSPRVCGLHCEQNLQVLFSEDNAAKSNRTWPGA